LGLQDITRDFGSGFVLLFERSIQPGDLVEVDNYLGTVERVRARSVVLRTLDHISIIVPNSKFITSNVINWSYANPMSRLRLAAPVAYGSDVDKVRSCLLQAASEHSQVLKFPVPSVVFLGYGDSALDFQLFVWIRDPALQIPITSDLYFRMEELFREHQVEIPFPQRDLHLRSGNWPIRLASDIETFAPGQIEPR
jgi:small-conductance mechanosensitive channel